MSDDNDDKQPDNRDGIEKAIDFVSDKFNRLGKIKFDAGTEQEFFRHAKANNAAALTRLLDAGFDPNTYNASGQTALHVAAIAGAGDVVRALIAAGADPKLGQKEDPAHTPIEDAVNFNKPDMVELLARSGGYVPGAKTKGFTLLHRACEKGKVRIIEALLKAGTDPNETTDNGATPLLVAVSRGQLDAARALLRCPEAAAQMNTQYVSTDPQKRNAFLLAVDRRQNALVDEMIKAGANVNATDAEDRTPIMMAIESADIEMIERLAHAGADLNKSVGKQDTPLVYACVVEMFDDDMRAKMIDCLIRLGADPDIASQRGRAPVHLAITMMHGRQVLETLLSYPIDKDQPDVHGMAAIHFAAIDPPCHYLRALLKAGANVNLRSGNDASTALIQAVKAKNTQGVELLLAAGAHPGLYDAYGKSALSYARETAQLPVIALLEDAMKRIASNQNHPAAKRKRGGSP